MQATRGSDLATAIVSGQRITSAVIEDAQYVKSAMIIGSGNDSVSMTFFAKPVRKIQT